MLDKIKNIEVYENYNLSSLSTMKVGGNARYFIVVNSLKSLIKTLKELIKNDIKFKIIGSGSNILFDDLGYNGAIIKLNFNYVKIKNKILSASSDVKIGTLISATKKNGLTGLENFVGIPASLGGAIFNNMGAYEKEISNNLIKIKYLEINNKKIIRKSKIIKNNDFSYRKCNFLNNFNIILFAQFKFDYLDVDTINLNIHNYFNKKNNSQPLECFSLGSIFKRNGKIFPAKLIDELGLKGAKIGGAEISTKHAGFIINSNNATSSDIKNLIEFIKQRIDEIYGYTLDEEIEYLPY